MPQKEAANNHDVGSIFAAQIGLSQTSPQSPQNDINPTLRWFFKDLLLLHFSVKPRKPILTFEGRNFLAWREALSTTISFVYKLKDQPTLVFLKNTDPDSKASLFLVIPQTVKDSSHAPQHWQFLMNSSDAAISLHILTNWSHKTQDTVNKSAFDVVLRNRLRRLDLPATFKSVSEAIQAAETAAASVVPVALIDHNASVSEVQYFPPNSSASIPAKMPDHFYQATAGPPNQTPPQHLLPNMLEKATAFKGWGQTKSLIEQFGNLCLYCKKGKHWYADCHKFWADVQAGRAVALAGMWHCPLPHSSKGKAPQV
ncbi:hypothetical protein O181_014661 [Austropuccinia psidii MF-1]|uniref:Uncharacterized protein n=1 Tax=Austropuccinia psidii MF-1 TaxID=1389203 RepID=A0A9Q3BYI7_9BASI|nr:hypothetical protein [Austropuccinia psidii MF-1]